MSNIRVLTIEDGGNPRLSRSIQRTENGFWIRPFSEDGSGTYKFRLNVRIESDVAQTVRFTVDWGELEHQEHRELVYLTIGEGDDFQTYPAEIDGTLCHAELPVPAGVSYLSMLPRYEHGRMLSLLKGLPSAVFDVYSIGESLVGREILAAEAGNRSLAPIAFYARVHPYETIGNFFMEGMTALLSCASAEAEELLARNHFLFVPMPNPDGVADGTCKLTHGGLNFSVNFRSSTEPEAAALKRYFAEKRPEMVVDLHGWMLFVDNMVTNDSLRGRVAYAELMAHEALFCKPTEIHYRKHPRNGAEHSCAYFADALGCAYFNTSWAHRGRTAQDFFDMGAVLLRAYAKANQAAGGKLHAVL